MVEVLNEDPHNMPIPDLTWDPDSTFERFYDKDRDVLSLYKEPKRPAVSLDIGGHFWVRFDPTSGEVVGLEFEDFERVFLVRYPELRVGWEGIKPKIIKKTKRQYSTADYLKMLLLFIQGIVKDHPNGGNLNTAQ